MHDFQSLYKEALSAHTEFQGHCKEMLLCCCEDKYFLSIRTSFHLAEEQYKKVNQICNDLSLWHASRVEGKKLTDWSQREYEENALVRSLLKATSGLMTAMQDAYLPWLTKSQLTEIHEVRSM